MKYGMLVRGKKGQKLGIDLDILRGLLNLVPHAAFLILSQSDHALTHAQDRLASTPPCTSTARDSYGRISLTYPWEF